MDKYYISAISPHVMDCTRQLYSELQPADVSPASEWMYITNQVLYFAYPVVLFLALSFTLANSIITAKMVTDSHECYLAGFNVAAFVMIMATVALQIPNYFPMDAVSAYTEMLPFIPAVENWCWYTCTWLLFTAVFERVGHAMCGRWHSSFGRIHGILVSLLIIVICFVVSLPQYWEYRVVRSYESHSTHNCTRFVIAPRDNILQQEAGYGSEYYYYSWIVLAFSIALPYLILPIMLPAMCCVKMHSYTALSTNGKISTYADDYSTVGSVKDERSFNRMLCAIVIFYLLVSGPRNAVRAAHNPPFFYTLCEDKLLSDTLTLLFDMSFYLIFVLVFLFYLGMSEKFRKALKSLKCRCCASACCRSTE